MLVGPLQKVKGVVLVGKLQNRGRKAEDRVQKKKGKKRGLTVS